MQTTRDDLEAVVAPRALFLRGFLAMLPLWAGAIPVGVAYGVAARDSGLSPVEAQLMSLIVFSAAAQVSAVSLLAEGTSTVVMVGTAIALSAQLLLLSLAVGRQFRLSWPSRFITAWFLTDGAYGVAAARGRLSRPVLLGAGVSMYVGWNLGSGLGAGIGHALPDLRRIGIDLVAPLTFLAVLVPLVLVPLVRTRVTLFVAIVAGLATLLLARIAPSGVAVLGSGVTACAAGAWWTRHGGEDNLR